MSVLAAGAPSPVAPLLPLPLSSGDAVDRALACDGVSFSSDSSFLSLHPFAARGHNRGRGRRGSTGGRGSSLASSRNPLPFVLPPKPSVEHLVGASSLNPPISSAVFPPLSSSFVVFPPLFSSSSPPPVPAATPPSFPPSAPALSRPWISLLSSNRCKSSAAELSFIPPSLVEGSKIVVCSEEDISSELDRWKYAAVGYVLGANPPAHIMQRFVENRWKEVGAVKVASIGSGVYVFDFVDGLARQSIMDLGPWSYNNKPLILKPWGPDTPLDKSEIKNIPIWIRLPRLKLQYWNSKSLSRIASYLGTPLFTDRVTSERSRLAYARVCIEVTPQSELPNSIPILRPNGSSFTQAVEYEWKPAICESCSCFGHKRDRCALSTPLVSSPLQAEPPSSLIPSIPPTENHGENVSHVEMCPLSADSMGDPLVSSSNSDNPDTSLVVANSLCTFDNNRFAALMESVSNPSAPCSPPPPILNLNAPPQEDAPILSGVSSPPLSVHGISLRPQTSKKTDVGKATPPSLVKHSILDSLYDGSLVSSQQQIGREASSAADEEQANAVVSPNACGSSDGSTPLPCLANTKLIFVDEIDERKVKGLRKMKRPAVDPSSHPLTPISAGRSPNSKGLNVKFRVT